MIIAVVVAYALSPIDWVPYIIPVLGDLDDVCSPLGIHLAQVYPGRGLTPGTPLNKRAAIWPHAAPQPS